MNTPLDLPNPFHGYVFTGLSMGAPITGFQFSQIGFTNLDASDATSPVSEGRALVQYKVTA